MIFTETPLAGAYVIEPEPYSDSRGRFVRVWCRCEFAANGIDVDPVQANLSINPHRGTLRGLHFQHQPHAEAKLMRCQRGAVFDAIVDLRPQSVTHGRWFGVELSPENGRILYVPEGFAHGFQTLVDDTEVTYLVSNYYTPAAAAGVRYDDSDLAIAWPLPVSRISDQDRSWPSLSRLREAAAAAV